MSRTRPSDELLFNRLVEAVKALPRDRQEQLLAELAEGDTVTVEHIAAHFNASWRTIQRRLKDGSIKGTRAGLRWMVTREEFERLKREGFPAVKLGRPFKGSDDDE